METLKVYDLTIPEQGLLHFLEFIKMDLPTKVKSLDLEKRREVDTTKPYWLSFEDVREDIFRVLPLRSLDPAPDFSVIDRFMKNIIKDYDRSNWLLQHFRGNVLEHTDTDTGGTSLFIPIKTQDNLLYIDGNTHVPKSGQPFRIYTKVRHGLNCPLDRDTVFLAYLNGEFL